MQKISNYIFIATPQSVELSGDFQEFITGGNLGGVSSAGGMGNVSSMSAMGNVSGLGGLNIRL